ncbi:hypothetical protein AGR1A_Cc20127 [Agrobacterium fabacearum CFBP 5771]|nr:hypothetical protein AGR1A_Cc20127 [Agrobacterium fabacearum CFBP 5771]
MPSQLTFLLNGRPRQDLLDHLKCYNLEYFGDFSMSWGPAYGNANLTAAGKNKDSEWLQAHLTWP